MIPVNLWRVVDRNPASPAHLISHAALDGVRVMGCDWIPVRTGLVLTQGEMLAGHRFACVCCMRVALGRPS